LGRCSGHDLHLTLRYSAAVIQSVSYESLSFVKECGQ
jgi:hypothetical protein